MNKINSQPNQLKLLHNFNEQIQMLDNLYFSKESYSHFFPKIQKNYLQQQYTAQSSTRAKPIIPRIDCHLVKRNQSANTVSSVSRQNKAHVRQVSRDFPSDFFNSIAKDNQKGNFNHPKIVKSERQAMQSTIKKPITHAVTPYMDDENDILDMIKQISKKPVNHLHNDDSKFNEFFDSTYFNADEENDHSPKTNNNEVSPKNDNEKSTETKKLYQQSKWNTDLTQSPAQDEKNNKQIDFSATFGKDGVQFMQNQCKKFNNLQDCFSQQKTDRIDYTFALSPQKNIEKESETKLSMEQQKTVKKNIQNIETAKRFSTERKNGTKGSNKSVPYSLFDFARKASEVTSKLPSVNNKSQQQQHLRQASNPVYLQHQEEKNKIISQKYRAQTNVMTHRGQSINNINDVPTTLDSVIPQSTRNNEKIRRQNSLNFGCWQAANNPSAQISFKDEHQFMGNSSSSFSKDNLNNNINNNLINNNEVRPVQVMLSEQKRQVNTTTKKLKLSVSKQFNYYNSKYTDAFNFNNKNLGIISPPLTEGANQTQKFQIFQNLQSYQTIENNQQNQQLIRKQSDLTNDIIFRLNKKNDGIINNNSAAEVSEKTQSQNYEIPEIYAVKKKLRINQVPQVTKAQNLIYFNNNNSNNQNRVKLFQQVTNKQENPIIPSKKVRVTINKVSSEESISTNNTGSLTGSQSSCTNENCQNAFEKTANFNFTFNKISNQKKNSDFDQNHNTNNKMIIQSHQQSN